MIFITETDCYLCLHTYIFLLGIILLLFSFCVFLGAKVKILAKKQSDFSVAEKEILIQNDAQHSFFATIVHDLKTPIIAQLRSISLILNESFGSVNEEQKEILKLTEDSCKYTLKLVTSILDSYKLDCKKLNLNKSYFDMQSLINSCLKETNLLAKEKCQTFVFDANTDGNVIFADYLQIKRVILNLLSNSITYGFENTTISVNYCQTRDFGEFFVTNRGNLISKEDMGAMFDKFTQTEFSQYNALGTRLGLYLSKQIITLHGGNIYAKCTEEGVCTFGFVLPTKILTESENQQKTLS